MVIRKRSKTNHHSSIINNHLACPNHRNTPNSAATPNKPPIQPKLSTNYDVIMQNKPNFRKAKMKVNVYSTKDYENKTLSGSGKNKANSKPIKANSKPISPKTKPIQTQYKPKQTQYKPNQTQ